MREPKFWMRVWDLPTRLYHWLLPVLLGAAYAAWRLDRMELYTLVNAGLMTILLFRILWGLAGSDTARFRSFLRGPGAVLKDVRALIQRTPDAQIGHTALGGWMAVLTLITVLGETLLSLTAPGPAGEPTPLTATARTWWGPGCLDALTYWHVIGAMIVMGLLGLHVLAVLIYAVVKQQNLVHPMITGRKRLSGRLRQPHQRGLFMALIVLAFAALVVWVGLTRLGQFP